VSQIAVEASTVSTVLRHTTSVRSSIGARKTVHGQACLSRTSTQMFYGRSLVGQLTQQAAFQATRSEVPTARPPLMVALPRYSWHE
jgi:hypothetical protein